MKLLYFDKITIEDMREMIMLLSKSYFQVIENGDNDGLTEDQSKKLRDLIFKYFD